MNLHTLRYGLWISSASAVGVSLVVLTLALLAGDPPLPPLKPSTAKDTAAAPPSLPAFSTFTAALDVKLRRPLVDIAPTGPHLSFKLAGTITDPTAPQAMILLANGKQELKGIGDRIGAAVIEGINEDSAVISLAGQRFTLKVLPPRKN